MKAVVSILLLPFAASALAGSASSTEITDRVLADLQRARQEHGLPALIRVSALEEAASRRARQVASLPSARRMSPPGSIQKIVEEVGIKRYRTVTEHMEIQSGYPDPAAAVSDRWRKYGPHWSDVMDASNTRVGMATATAEDGTIVFVAVLLADWGPLPDLRSLERETTEAINREREERGLRPLIWSEELAAAAREHSEDMAGRRYFDHETPEGSGPGSRVDAHHFLYVKVAENIAESVGAEDPVAVAVRGWLKSPGHRANLLDGEFTHTGIGVAATEDREFYFTQLFMLPQATAE